MLKAVMAECSRALGKSAATLSTIGHLFVINGWRDTWKDSEKVWWWQRKAYRSPSILGCGNSNHAMELTWAQHTAHPIQQRHLRHLQASSLRASARSSCGSSFFSFLMDRTTDAGNQEDELVVLLYFSKDAIAQEITCYCQSIAQEKLMQVVYFCVWMRL